jgi:hypothetical protein
MRFTFGKKIMKIVAMICWGILLFCVASAQTERTFEVGRVSPDKNAVYSRDKLLVLFEAVVAAKRGPQKHPARIEIIQNLEPGRFLAKFELGGGDKIFSVTTLTKGSVPDGSIIELYLGDTGELYTYVSTLGAKRTVSAYTEIEPPTITPDMTREEFIASLKDGDSYTVSLNELEPCKKGCFQGKRRGKGNDFGESPDRWFDCRHCREGFTTVNVTYTIIWAK